MMVAGIEMSSPFVIDVAFHRSCALLNRIIVDICISALTFIDHYRFSSIF